MNLYPSINAIRRSSSDNVGQPRVRFPADAVNSSSGACPFAVFWFMAWGTEGPGPRLNYAGDTDVCWVGRWQYDSWMNLSRRKVLQT
jgi:hypothetical protein